MKWPQIGTPVASVDDVQQTVVLSVDATEISGPMFRGFNQSDRARAKMALIDLLTRVALTEIYDPQPGPAAPAVGGGGPRPAPVSRPRHAPPEVLYEALRDDAYNFVGWRVYFVSHAPSTEFSFGAGLDRLFDENRARRKAELRRGGRSGSVAQARDVGSAVSTSVDGISLRVVSRDTLYAFLCLVDEEFRVNQFASVANRPLDYATNPGNPALKFGLAREIERPGWPADATPRERSRRFSEYIRAPGSGRSAIAAASAFNAHDPGAVGDGTSTQAYTLTFPYPEDVYLVMPFMLEKLWSLPRPEQCVVDPDAVGAGMANILFGAAAAVESRVSHIEMMMAERDWETRMSLENRTQAEELRRRFAAGPADTDARRAELADLLKTALAKHAQDAFARYVTAFRSVDPAVCTPEMLEIRKYYVGLLDGNGTNGLPTLRRDFKAIDPTIGPFGNYFMHIRTFVDNVMRTYSTHPHFDILMMVALQAYHHNFDELQFSMLLPGMSGASKSWLLKMLKRCFIMGTVTMQTSKSDKADRTANTNLNDCIILEEEVRQSLLGLGYGRNAQPDDSYQKAAMGSGYALITMNRPTADGRQRETFRFIIPMNCVYIGASNDPFTNVSDAMSQRLMVLACNSITRDGIDPTAFFDGAWFKDPEAEAIAIERIRIVQALVFLTEKLIKVGAFRDVDMTIAGNFAAEFSAVLKAHDIPYVYRDIYRFRNICRTMAIVDAVNRLFLCAGSAIPMDAPWTDNFLRAIEPLLVTTTETCTMALSMMCQMLVPDFQQAVIRAAITGCDTNVPEDTATTCPSTLYMAPETAQALSSAGGRLGAAHRRAGATAAPAAPTAPAADITDAERRMGVATVDPPAASAPPLRFNAYDYILLSGDVNRVVDAVVRTIMPKPPIQLIRQLFKKLQTTTIQARNRNPDGDVIAGMDGQPRRQGVLDFMFQSQQAGTHPIRALIADQTVRGQHVTYIAQDLLIQEGATPMTILLATVSRLCNKHTTPARLVTVFPLRVRIPNPDALMKNFEAEFAALTIADRVAPTVDVASPPAATGGFVQEFPQIHSIVTIKPDPRRCSEIVTINAPNEATDAALYCSVHGSAPPHTVDIVLLNYDVETRAFFDRIGTIPFPDDVKEYAMTAIPYYHNRVEAKIASRLGSKECPRDFVRAYLRNEVRRRGDHSSAPTVECAMISAVKAAADPEAFAEELLSSRYPDMVVQPPPPPVEPTPVRAAAEPGGSRMQVLVRQQQQQRAAAQPCVVATAATTTLLFSPDTARHCGASGDESDDGTPPTEKRAHAPPASAQEEWVGMPYTSEEDD
ncbi:MAG: hypothetical protein WC732_09790 [Candidatus Omnitrophota bacterium]